MLRSIDYRNNVPSKPSESKDRWIIVYLPTASPEFMVLERGWNISKNDLLVLTDYKSFRDFRMRIGQLF